MYIKIVVVGVVSIQIGNAVKRGLSDTIKVHVSIQIGNAVKRGLSDTIKVHVSNTV